MLIRGKNQKGYTYVMLLAAVVIMGIMAEAANQLVSSKIKVDKEAELLFRGAAYLQAIESYYKAGKTVKTLPTSLDDLLNDPRYPNKHHLRQLYLDPFTGQNFRLILSVTGGITGVSSASTQAPRKNNNFPMGLEHFINTPNYSEWVFIFNPEMKKKAATKNNLKNNNNPIIKRLEP